MRQCLLNFEIVFNIVFIRGLQTFLTDKQLNKSYIEARTKTAGIKLQNIFGATYTVINLILQTK